MSRTSPVIVPQPVSSIDALGSKISKARITEVAIVQYVFWNNYIIPAELAHYCYY